MRVVIIGGSHGGISAARHLRKINPQVEVIIIEKSGVLGYIASSVNLVLEHTISELSESRTATPSELLSEGINVMLNSCVTGIKTKEKVVDFTTNSIDSAVSDQIHYDYLILAMGSSNFRTAFSHGVEEEITTYKTLRQAKSALNKIKEAKNVAIIGAGLIGFELAESLGGQAKDVYLIDRMDTLLFRYFDDEISQILTKSIPKNIHIRLNSSVAETEHNQENQLNRIKLTNGEVIPADVMVYAVNPKPNVKLVEDFLKLNADGTIETNEYLQTSDPFIYAVGDLVSVPFNHSDHPIYIPLVTNAYRSGIVAATNILFEEKMPFPKMQRTVVSKLFDYYVGSSGVNETEAPYYGFKVDSITKTFRSQSFFEKDTTFEVTIKVVYDQVTKKVMGGQIITNQKESLEILNTISTLISTQTTLDQLSTMDFFFNPTLSYPLHFLNQLALEGALRIRKKGEFPT